MNTTWSSAVAWARGAVGGSDAEIDDTEARQALERAKEATAQSVAVAEAVAAQYGTPPERSDGDKKQSLMDSVYLIAAADGEISAEERAKIAAALGALLGASMDGAAVDAGLESARAHVQSHGAVATADAVAKSVPDLDGRASILAVASSVAWLGRGVGTKEGLVLQTLARAFGISLADLHKLMVVGKLT
jgi:tellurite resistance protein